MVEPIIDVELMSDILAQELGDSIRDLVPARLGHPITGDVEIDLANVDLPGSVYVHGIGNSGATPGSLGFGDEDGVLQIGDDQSFTTALMLPNKIPPGLMVYNCPVLLKRKGELYYVEDLNGIIAIEFLFGLKERLQRSVDISQFDYGLLRPATPPSLRVMVSRARYNFDGTIYDIPALLSDSLEAHVPGSGLARAVRLDVRVADKTLVITAGDTTFDESLSHEAGFDDYYPKVVPTGQFVSGWVKLYGGMQQILIPDIYWGQELYTKTSPNLTIPDVLNSVVTVAGEVVVSDGKIVWSTEP